MSCVEITDEDVLYRRIIKNWIKDDGSVSSAAFTDYHLSVDLAELTTPELTRDRGDNPKYTYGVVQFLAGIAKKNNQQVYHKPIVGNYSHSIVEGEKNKPKSKSVKRALSKASQIALFP